MKLNLAILVMYAVCLAAYCGSPTASDYERSLRLRDNWITLTRDVVFPPTWVADSHQFVYKKSVKDGFIFLIEDADTGHRQPAFNQDSIAKALGDALGHPIDPLQLPFEQVVLDPIKKTLSFSYHYEPWLCLMDGSECHAVLPEGRPKADDVVRDLRISLNDVVVFSPDKNKQLTTDGFNLVVKDNSGTVLFGTKDGTAAHFYDIESVKWAPNSERILAVKVKPGQARFVTRVLTAPDDQLQPKVITQLYPKPGDRVDIEQPIIIDLNPAKVTLVDNQLFPNPYMLTDFQWRKNSESFVFHYVKRGHQVERIIEVNADTGQARILIDETADTFIYQWRGVFHDVNQQGEESIWLSERDGWAHLYLFDNDSNTIKTQITKGNWPVREVVKVDDQTRQIYFAASGMNEGEDPYFVHYYRVNFDGTGLTPLTSAMANHEVRFSDDMKYYVDVYSRVDLANIAQLHLTQNAQWVRNIAKGEMTQLTAAGFKPPKPFVAKGRDNQSDIWGLIVTPTNFDPNKKYPVIENIYAGPHDSFVPKSFWPFGYHSGGDKVIGMQALADLGFVVVQIDGMGTANRSKAFHDVAWMNLGDSGFPDRILWHKAAAERYAWYDISRGVGIYGGSAGGQSTLAALEFHPDFYTVGVAFAGCFDNRMDKMSWNEQWMGYPVGPEYARASGVDNAHRLQGRILFITGEQDSNVDPASTMQVVDALIKANKDFDLLMIPGGEHSAGRSTGPVDYAQRRQFMFFVENLLYSPRLNWNAHSH